MITEIRTSGDVRRMLAETMIDIRTKKISVDQGAVIAQCAKALTDSMQVEVNIAKSRVQLLASGVEISKTQHMGNMLIAADAEPSVPEK